MKNPPSDGNKPQSPRHLEISGPIAVTTTLNASQTLPRPIKHRDSPETDMQVKHITINLYLYL